MKAAVLHQFGDAPRYEDFPAPVSQEGERLLTVKAASLTNIARMWSQGSHYDGYQTLPVVVGVDGVGLTEDGRRIYTGGSRLPYGMIAEQTVVPQAFGVPIPDAISDAVAAALPNASLSSWLPLEYRAQLQAGETVFILGATGVSGRLAVQIAKHLGAGKVIAAGRNAASLEALRDLGADAVVSLDQSDSAVLEALAKATGGQVNIVLDYLWGHPAELLLTALTGHDTSAENNRVRYISIGEMAGATAAVRSAALRSSGIEIYGSGGGSVSYEAIFKTFPKLWALAEAGQLTMDVECVPLADVEAAWQKEPHGKRTVFVP